MPRAITETLEFCKAWNGAENVKEVAESTGLTVKSCQTKAAGLRKKGVNLKKMNKGGGRRLDVAAINEALSADEGDEQTEA